MNIDYDTGINNSYAVLTDLQLYMIINSHYVFVFKGYVNNQLVVNEAITIKADRCHIDYVSGNLNVSL